jgi:hypothetical protein
MRFIVVFVCIMLNLPALRLSPLLQVTHDVSHLSCADFLRAPGVQTPVIVRFSTGAAARGCFRAHACSSISLQTVWPASIVCLFTG